MSYDVQKFQDCEENSEASAPHFRIISVKFAIKEYEEIKI